MLAIALLAGLQILPLTPTSLSLHPGRISAHILRQDVSLFSGVLNHCPQVIHRGLQGARLRHWYDSSAGLPSWSQGPRLTEQIGGLFSNVDAQFSAPTAAQLQLLGEIEREYDAVVADLTPYFTDTVPGLNTRLQEAGVPPVSILE